MIINWYDSFLDLMRFFVKPYQTISDGVIFLGGEKMRKLTVLLLIAVMMIGGFSTIVKAGEKGFFVDNKRSEEHTSELQSH